jgi:methylmalonyl-CoA mutase N-terminal domain/subunit
MWWTRWVAYVIEAWTDRIEAQASEYIGRIEAMGGALAAIERGFVQREIQDAAYRAQREIEEGSQVVVGVNRFQEGESKSPPVFRVNDEVQRAQVERLRAVKARRNEAEVKRTLEALENAAKTGENLMPPILAAVEAYATVGEIAGTLAAVFGEHREGGWS